MEYKRISAADKLRLVRAFRNSEDYVLLANQLGIKQNTARKIVARALKREDPENVEEKTRGGEYHVKVDNEMRETIAEIIVQCGRHLSSKVQRLFCRAQCESWCGEYMFVHTR